MYLATDQLPKDVKKHLLHKQKRNERFARGVYGVVQPPVKHPGVITLCEPPSYLTSRHTVRFRKLVWTGIDWRCFYSGVECYWLKKNAHNHDSKVLPWLGTKDHLVPIRRGVPENVGLSKYSSSMLWTSNIANQTLGLAPLPVRLKIREWLSTTTFDRTSLTIESGNALRWILIDMLDEFRFNGRFPWSRNQHGQYWNATVSVPLMNKWYNMEREFLALNEIDRDQYIKSFVWYF
jgi:hypothetical protein